MEDLLIETLIIEEDRPEHIANHGIILDEVFKVIERNYEYIKGREDRWLSLTKQKRANSDNRAWAAKRTLYLWLSDCPAVSKTREKLLYRADCSARR